MEKYLTIYQDLVNKINMKHRMNNKESTRFISAEWICSKQSRQSSITLSSEKFDFPILGIFCFKELQQISITL